MSPKHKRKSGGQPGNQNARKHGYYSKFLSPDEKANLEKAVDLEGLDYEIALARQKIKSVVKNDPENHDAFFRAFANFRSLMRIKQQLANGNVRKIARAVEYVLKDSAAISGLSRSNESGSLPKNELASARTESASLDVPPHAS